MTDAYCMTSPTKEHHSDWQEGGACLYCMSDASVPSVIGFTLPRMVGTLAALPTNVQDCIREYALAAVRQSEAEAAKNVAMSEGPNQTWKAVTREAEGIVIGGTKYLMLDEEMTFRMGEALEMAYCNRSHPHENMDAICVRLTTRARERNEARKVANDAAYWIVEVMRGTTQETLYAQAVMEKARDHIQRMALLLHDAADDRFSAPLQDEPKCNKGTPAFEGLGTESGDRGREE